MKLVLSSSLGLNSLKDSAQAQKKSTSCSVAQINNALIFINPYSEGASTDEFLRNLALYSQVLYLSWIGLQPF